MFAGYWGFVGGFESIDYPYMARINSSGLTINPVLPIQRGGNCRLQNKFSADVFLLKLFPGISAEIFYNLAQMGVRGIYVESFGIGGACMRAVILRFMKWDDKY